MYSTDDRLIEEDFWVGARWWEFLIFILIILPLGLVVFLLVGILEAVLFLWENAQSLAKRFFG